MEFPTITASFICEGLIFALTHKKIRWLSFYYGLMMSLTLMGIVIFFQLYLKHINIQIKYFGIIYAVVIIFGAFISMKAYKIENWLGEKLTLYMLPLLLGLVYILMAFYNLYWGFLLLFIIEAVYCIITPVLDDYMHKHVKSKQRATVLSIRNLFSSIAFIIISPLIGWIGDFISLTSAFLTAGLIVLIFGSITMMFWRKSLVNV